MKEIILISDRKKPENNLHFRVNDKLFNDIFHLLGFLAESGDNEHCVRYCKKYFGITLLKNGGDYKMKYYIDELCGEEGE